MQVSTRRFPSRCTCVRTGSVLKYGGTSSVGNRAQSHQLALAQPRTPQADSRGIWVTRPRLYPEKDLQLGQSDSSAGWSAPSPTEQSLAGSLCSPASFCLCPTLPNIHHFWSPPLTPLGESYPVLLGLKPPGKNVSCGTGEMAQLLCRHEDLGCNLQHPQ